MMNSILSSMSVGRLRLPDIVIGAVLLFGLGWPLYQIWPTLLPVRILEGPFVQQSTESGGIVVWMLSRPAQCSLQVVDGTSKREIEPDRQGARYAAPIDGLAAAQSYAYSIRRSSAAALFENGILRTSKSPGAAFRFIVFGDSGKGYFEQYELGTLMAKYDPDFLLHTGDLIYGGGERDRYPNRFFAPYQKMLEQISFWPCIGNHDNKNINSIEDVFEAPRNGPADLPPEHNYWFDYADARFAVIDSMASKEDLRDKIAPWLDTVFTNSTATWRFVAFHHPPYTAANHKPNKRVQEMLVPAIDRNSIDIVFNGHDHVYERTAPMRDGQIVEAGQGTLYIVTGAGGGRLYEMLPKDEQPDYIAASFDRTFSFTLVTIDADGLQLQQVALNDEIVDELEMKLRDRGNDTEARELSEPAKLNIDGEGEAEGARANSPHPTPLLAGKIR